MKHYLGIDIGTFETKGVIVNGEGDIVASAARPHQMIVPQPGWAEHRAVEDWWGDFTFVCRKMLAESKIASKSISGVGTSGIGPCMLPVDRDGTPLMNAVLYGVDTRAAREMAELNAAIGEETLLARCGNTLTSQSVGPKILWLKRNRPELYARTHKILNSTSYLVHRLTGRHTVDHHTAAGSSPLYLADEQKWSADIAPDIAPLELLPDIHWSTDIVGELHKTAAEETGLAAGTPVIAGTIDAVSEAVSVGVTAPGDMMLMYGSTIFIILITPERVRDGRLWYAPWVFRGQHGSMSGLATSGTLTHWFRNQFARELPAADAAPMLAAEAAGSPPGAKGLVLLPYFSGERTPLHDPAAKGVFFGLDLTHDRGDLFRAVLEGIGYGTRHILETYREAGHSPSTIYSVGGGTKNKVWAQAMSDICGMRQIIRKKTFGASYGDAFLAAVALGDAKREDIGKWNPVDSQFTPEAAHRKLYVRQYAIFRGLYPATRHWMHELSASP